MRPTLRASRVAGTPRANMPAMAPQRRWVRVAVPVMLVVLASGIRLWGLGQPRELYWDEHYYVFDAEAYLGGGIGQPDRGSAPP